MRGRTNRRTRLERRALLPPPVRRRAVIRVDLCERPIFVFDDERHDQMPAAVALVAHAEALDAFGASDFLNIHHDGIEEEIHTERAYSYPRKRVKTPLGVRDSLGV